MLGPWVSGPTKPAVRCAPVFFHPASCTANSLPAQLHMHATASAYLLPHWPCWPAAPHLPPPPAIHWCSAGIAQRLKAASLVSKQAAAAARQQADAITTRLDSLLGTSSVLLLPTTPFPGGRLPHAVCAAAVAHTPCVCVCVHHCVRSQALPTPIPPSIFSHSCAIAPPFLDAAPPLGSDLEAQPDNVGRLMALTSIASLAGLPQV